MDGWMDGFDYSHRFAVEAARTDQREKVGDGSAATCALGAGQCFCAAGPSVKKLSEGIHPGCIIQVVKVNIQDRKKGGAVRWTWAREEARTGSRGKRETDGAKERCRRCQWLVRRQSERSGSSGAKTNGLESMTDGSLLV